MTLSLDRYMFVKDHTGMWYLIAVHDRELFSKWVEFVKTDKGHAFADGLEDGFEAHAIGTPEGFSFISPKPL